MPHALVFDCTPPDLPACPKASAKSFGGPTAKLTSVTVNSHEYVKFTAETPSNIGEVIGGAAFNAGIGVRVKRLVADNFNTIVVSSVNDAAKQNNLFGKTMAKAVTSGIEVGAEHTIPFVFFSHSFPTHTSLGHVMACLVVPGALTTRF
jgi:hypothetical protein